MSRSGRRAPPAAMAITDSRRINDMKRIIRRSLMIWYSVVTELLRFTPAAFRIISMICASRHPVSY